MYRTFGEWRASKSRLPSFNPSSTMASGIVRGPRRPVHAIEQISTQALDQTCGRASHYHDQPCLYEKRQRPRHCTSVVRNKRVTRQLTPRSCGKSTHHCETHGTTCVLTSFRSTELGLYGCGSLRFPSFHLNDAQWVQRHTLEGLAWQEQCHPR